MIIHLPIGYEYQLDTTNILDFSSVLPEGGAGQPPVYHIDHEYGRMVFLIVPILRAGESVTFGMNITPPTFANFAVNLMVFPPLDELLSPDFAENPESTLASLAGGGGSTSNPPNGDDCRAQTRGSVNRCYLNFARSLFFYVLSFVPGLNKDCVDVAVGLSLGVADLFSGVVLNNVVGGDQVSGSSIGGAGFSLLGGLIDNAAKCVGKSVPFLSILSKIGGAIQLLIGLYECLNKELCLRVARPIAQDPNEKVGPRGFGLDAFVPARRPLHYQVSFENLADAEAPAQRIFLTDVLPPELDPRTVRLKEIEFNHKRFVVPDNQAFYSTRVDFDSGENAIKADISAGLDVVNRRITWTLTAIDPATGDLPLDPFIGLLPPNNEANDGQGFVTFTVEAYPQFPNRTPIANKATIVFDENAPIETNSTMNLLDSVVPASSIATLPANMSTNEIELAWSGTDDTDGSGFAACEIRVSENNSAFSTVFTSDQLNGSYLFPGKWGTDYKFYTMCSDNAGNIEAAPAVADAFTRTPGGATESDVAPRPTGNDGVVNGDDAQQIRRFAAGLDADFLNNEYQRADTAPLVDGGNGSLTVGDVVQARRYITGLDVLTPAAGPNAAAAPLASAAAPKQPLGGTRDIWPMRISRVGNKLLLGINLDAQGDEAGIGFTLNFDPAVLSLPTNISLGSGAAGSTLTANALDAADGKLGILLDRDPNQPFPAGITQIVRIEFTIAPGSPSTTNMSFGNGDVAEEMVGAAANVLMSSFSPSLVSLSGPTSAAVALEGVVLNIGREPISNARVVVTGSDGTTTTALTNPYGRFRIERLAAGRFYTVSTFAKNRTFDQVGVTMTDDVSGFEIIARE
jgi:hypothetical protein